MGEENLYEGIGRTTYSNSLKCEPMTIESLQRGFDLMRERERERRDYEVKVATEYRKAMQDPVFADRQAALFQAAMDIGCPMPDPLNPLNPPIVSKKMYDALQKRADEIQAEKL